MIWRILDVFEADPDPFKDAFKKAFIPEPDITTYELAEIVSHIGPVQCSPRYGITFTSKGWDEVPDNIKRHFKDMP